MLTLNLFSNSKLANKIWLVLTAMIVAGPAVANSLASVSTDRVTVVSSVDAPHTLSLVAASAGQIGMVPASAPVLMASADPGAGGFAAQATTPAPAITMTATDADGINTNTARLGVPVTLASTITGTYYKVVGWSVTGGGTIVATGTNASGAIYTPPTSMPTSNQVTVTAYIKSSPTVSTSYTLTLQNPIPAVAAGGVSPAQLKSGATQPLALVGTGFVPGTVVLFNGKTLPIVYTDYKHAAVEVPVASTATGSLSLQVRNPAPGGGTSAAFVEPIAAATIALSSKVNGVVTNEVPLGGVAGVVAIVSGSAQTAVTWSVSGSGSMSSAGLYTAPAALGSSNIATVTATLVSNPAISQSYQLTLVNPTPLIMGASPQQIPSGTTTTVTLNGKGFVPGTTVLVGNGTALTTYQSPTSLLVKVTLAAGLSGNLSMQAQNTSPGGGTSATYNAVISNIQLTATNPDGTNTGTARLGVPVNLTTLVTGSSYQLMAWTLQGAGTLQVSGTNAIYATYTPPTTMPSSSSVNVVAYLKSNPSVTTTYPITLVNPIPTVLAGGATPAQLNTGSTQAVTLVGSGFVPGTVVLLNGTALPTAYTDASHATVQVPVSATASGSLSLQVKNPAPGGGAGTVFTETIAAGSITLSAVDQDGTNTGTADVGQTVNMSAAVAGSSLTAVNWSVSGPGSMSSSGVYTAPSAIPSNNAVVITAKLTSNPTVTASYSLTVVNPAPTINSSSPIQVPAGTTTAVTISGSGFVPSTVVLVGGSAVTTTYQSPTSVVAQITVASGIVGNLSLQAQNAAPGGGTSLNFQEAIASPTSVAAAARILEQTTFGPTSSLIQHVQTEGITAWLSEQFNTPTTLMDPTPATLPSYCATAAFCAESNWWKIMLTGNDQLRQRVAFALSELFVISTAEVQGKAIPTYQNMLANDAFTNWSTIMKDVTLSPGMGQYLNMLNSPKLTGNEIANENFARENMQLFNMGLFLLNQDGTLQLDSNGNPQPAYTEAQVEAFARVFTGWTYANPDGSAPTYFLGGGNFVHPLVAVEKFHDETAKTLLNGTVLPAGQTAEQDLDGALANVFNHPNVPPFVATQLIQHLVTGNPSAAYVARVAKVFTDDGNGVRGNMTAVLTAIFTDPEARAGDTDATADGGHLREPMLWMTSVMRGLGYVNTDPNNYYRNLSNYSSGLGEYPYGASSVFNYFPPTYVIPGTVLPGTQIMAPEFALENTGSAMVRLTLASEFASNAIQSFNADLSATSPLGLTATVPANLVDALGTLFTHGMMSSDTRTAIINAITPLTDPAERVQVATYLVIGSSEGKVSH